MKELSIEEKAKCYDEAIERAQSLKNKWIDEDGEDVAFMIFPELKESEDEQSRKWILEYLYDGLRRSDEQFKGQFKCAIAWLEKQKEPKYLDTLTCEPWSDEQTRINLINFLKSLGATEIPQASLDRYLTYLEKQGEQKPVWSEEDEEIHRKCICAMRASACGFPEEEKFVEQVDNWLKSIKDRVQPKQEWSEEDKRILNSIIQTAENHCFINLQERNWLKSLKDK